MKIFVFRESIFLYFLTAMLFFWCVSCKAYVTKVSSPPDSKTSFPIFELPIPQNKAYANYLGVSGIGNFKITQIKSQILIIEIFNVNCAHCQDATPLVHRLYLETQARLDLKGKVKIIGIGTDNNQEEVGFFQKTYHVPFPLFPDPHDVISKKLGGANLPIFIGVKNNGDGTMEKFLVKSGGFHDAKSFLEEILEKAKLE